MTLKTAQAGTLDLQDRVDMIQKMKSRRSAERVHMENIRKRELE